MAANYGFSVILEPQQGGGFTVLVPALPEVVTEGDSEKEALANAQDAIRAILEYRSGIIESRLPGRCQSGNPPRNRGRLRDGRRSAARRHW